MEKCMSCAQRYHCADKQEFDCRNNDYRDYCHDGCQILSPTRREERAYISTEEFGTERYLYVECISPRVTFASQIKVGEKYYIDRMSIYIDSDGDVYGSVFRENGVCVGNLKLSHFIGLG